MRKAWSAGFVVMMVWVTGLGNVRAEADEPAEVALPPSTLRVLQSDLAVAPPKPERTEVRESGIEFAVSSWMPRSASFSGDPAEKGTFQTGTLPALSVQYLPANWAKDLGWSEILPAVRLSAISLSSSTNLQVAGTTETLSQSLSLYSFGAGAELFPHGIARGPFQPHFGAMALPTLVMGSPSDAQKGYSAFALPFEMSAGVLTSIAANPSGFVSRVSVDLAAVQVLGETDAVNFRGFGVEGGLRIEL